MKNEYVRLPNDVILLKLQEPYFFAINAADIEAVEEFDEWYAEPNDMESFDVLADVEVEPGVVGQANIHDVIQAGLLNRGKVPEDSSVLFDHQGVTVN